MPRPRGVTFVAAWVFSLAALNILGALSGLRRYVLLSELPLALPPGWLIATSATWGLLFGLLGLGLLGLKTWARHGVLLGYTLYLAAGWVERLAFGASDYLRVAAPFTVGLHVLSLALMWGIMLRRKVRRAFLA
jgi:hypothetical protein